MGAVSSLAVVKTADITTKVVSYLGRATISAEMNVLGQGLKDEIIGEPVTINPIPVAVSFVLPMLPPTSVAIER